MMNFKKSSYLLLIISSIMVWGCSPKQIDPVLSDFTKSKHLKHVLSPIKSSEIGEIVDILILDSVLITNEMFNDYVFKLYNIRSGRIINQSVRKGRGPNEIPYPNLMNKYDNTTITTFDVNSKKLIYLSISELRNKSLDNLKYEYFDFGIFRQAQVNDSLMICTGMFDDGEYYLINKNSKQRIAKLDYNTSLNELQKSNNNIKSLAFQGELVVRPFHQEFAKVSSGAGVIEIGRVTDSNLEYISAKNYFMPDIRVVNNQPINNKKSRFAFHSLMATEKYFYTIYSGKSMEKEGSEFSSGRNLLVYSWDGKPIIHFQLDRDVKRMTLDEKAKIAYGYSVNPTTGEPEIVYYQIPEF